MILNAQMRRIDLLCKLFGPLFIALIAGFSTKVAIIANLVMNVTSSVLEYFAIARVYDEVPELQEAKQKPRSEPADAESARDPNSRFAQNWERIRGVFSKSARDFNFYFRHRAFLPSIAGALLYLTVLSFAGQMVTYLLSAGYTAIQVGIARTLSVAFEVLATWVAPWLMGQIGPARAGLWLSSWQVTTLVAGTALFWIFDDKPVVSASGLVGGTILSRLGLRGFDLCVQIIVQEVRTELIPGGGGGAVMYKTDRLLRMSRPRAVAHFPQLRRLGRTPSSFCLSHRLSSSPAPNSSSGPRSYLLVLSLWRGPRILSLSISGEDTYFISTH